MKKFRPRRPPRSPLPPVRQKVRRQITLLESCENDITLEALRQKLVFLPASARLGVVGGCYEDSPSLEAWWEELESDQEWAVREGRYQKALQHYEKQKKIYEKWQAEHAAEIEEWHRVQGAKKLAQEQQKKQQREQRLMSLRKEIQRLEDELVTEGGRDGGAAADQDYPEELFQALEQLPQAPNHVVDEDEDL